MDHVPVVSWLDMVMMMMKNRKNVTGVRVSDDDLDFVNDVGSCGFDRVPCTDISISYYSTLCYST